MRQLSVQFDQGILNCYDAAKHRVLQQRDERLEVLGRVHLQFGIIGILDALLHVLQQVERRGYVCEYNTVIS